MFRRSCLFLLTLLLCIGLAVPVCADVLWEPYDNNYYRNHFDDLDYLDQIYVVPEGLTVNVYEDPVKGGLLETLQAQTRIYIGPCAAIDGEVWGAGYALHGESKEGWVRLGRLQKEYDHQDFVNDHGDSFVQTDDQFTQTDIDADVHTWTYPGSGKSDGIIPKGALETGYNDGVLDFLYVYTDPDGGRWGYVGYYMGHFGWVWLDDPESPDAPLFPQSPANTVTDTSPTESDPVGTQLLWILIPLVLVTAVTGAAIYAVKRRKKTAGK